MQVTGLLLLFLQAVENDADSCKQLALVCKEALKKYECTAKKALDLMCSVGRFSYELSKYLEEVPYNRHVYIDYSVESARVG